MMKKETFCALLDAARKLSAHIDSLCEALRTTEIIMDDPLNDIYNVLINDSEREWTDEALDDLFNFEMSAEVLYDKIKELEELKNDN